MIVLTTLALVNQSQFLTKFYSTANKFDGLCVGVREKNVKKYLLSEYLLGEWEVVLWEYTL